MPSLMGVETEYAIVGVAADRQGVDRDALAAELLRRVAVRHPHLPALSGNGIFLANGMRLYVDAGGHPELCTPECTDPWETTRYIAAGERILADAAHEVVTADPRLREVLVLRTNVDYRSGTTWGCHESYLHTAPPAELPAQLIPHLVSRIIFSGAGGYDPRAAGLAFMLSPRAAFLRTAASEQSTSDRGIYHTRLEPLARTGYHRLHVIAGESLCSQVATCLKLGTTALVVAMIDAGLAPAEGVTLTSPVAALEAFARDAALRVTAQTVGGPAMSALDIQRRYLGRAESAAGRRFMPPWAGDVCRLWRTTLDALEATPASLGTTLDWAIKRALYAAEAERLGLPWRTLPIWTHVAARLGSARGLAAETRTRLTPVLEWAGVDWPAFARFVELRPVLLEVDLRFGQLDVGSFQALDAAGLLAHRQPRVGDVARAITEAPTGSRAAVRGAVIRRLAGQAGRAACDWHAVLDTTGAVLDLADPFQREERWAGRRSTSTR